MTKDSQQSGGFGPRDPRPRRGLCVLCGRSRFPARAAGARSRRAHPLPSPPPSFPCPSPSSMPPLASCLLSPSTHLPSQELRRKFASCVEGVEGAVSERGKAGRGEQTSGGRREADERSELSAPDVMYFIVICLYFGAQRRRKPSMRLPLRPRSVHTSPSSASPSMPATPAWYPSMTKMATSRRRSASSRIRSGG